MLQFFVYIPRMKCKSMYLLNFKNPTASQDKDTSEYERIQLKGYV